MPLKDTLEIIVNLVIVLGFIILVLGVGIWVFNLSQRFNLSIENMLIVFGCIFLIFGILAAKIFSKV